MRHAVGEHAGLARARPRHHQQRAAPVHDGLALRLVQPFQEGVGVGQVVDPAGPLPPRACRWCVGVAPTLAVGLGLARCLGVEEGAGPGGIRPSGGGEAFELVGVVEVPQPAEAGQRGARHPHSHSMVPGGFEVMSRATRFTPSTSLMMRVDMRSSSS